MRGARIEKRMMAKLKVMSSNCAPVNRKRGRKTIAVILVVAEASSASLHGQEVSRSQAFAGSKEGMASGATVNGVLADVTA